MQISISDDKEKDLPIEDPKEEFYCSPCAGSLIGRVTEFLTRK